MPQKYFNIADYCNSKSWKKDNLKTICFLCLLALVAIITSYFWLKAEQVDILEKLYTPIPWKEVEHIPKPEGMPQERILFRKRESKP